MLKNNTNKKASAFTQMFKQKFLMRYLDVKINYTKNITNIGLVTNGYSKYHNLVFRSNYIIYYLQKYCLRKNI